MKKVILFLILPFVVSGIWSIESCESTKSSASKLLEFNLQKGKGYDYEMVWDFHQDLMSQDIKMSIMTNYSMDVIDEDDSTKTIEAAYKDFKMNMKMMGMEIDVDTDKPSVNDSLSDLKGNPSALMSKIFSMIKGKKFDMKVNKEGKVLEVTGMDQLFGDMSDSLNLDKADKEKMGEAFKQQFNSDDIKKQFAQLFYIFPQKKVKVGDSWEKSYETDGKMPAKYTTTYKVKDIDGNMVTLSSKTDIESSSDQMKISGTQNGNLIVDSQIGLVVNADFDQDIDVTVGGITFTMKGKGKIKGTAK